MNKEAYKQKLQAFNDTNKYFEERDLLIHLLSPQFRERILDYGCGLGRIVHHINMMTKADCFGFDVNDLVENKTEHFRNSFHFRFHKVYFMHSLAHIPGLAGRLNILCDMLEHRAKVLVLTPNQAWIDELKRKEARNYEPDPTLVMHFTKERLIMQFIDIGFRLNYIGETGEMIGNTCERLFAQFEYYG